MEKKFTKEEILGILEFMADNLMWLRQSIEQGNFKFDLDVATAFAAEKYDPVMEYLMRVPGYVLPD